MPLSLDQLMAFTGQIQPSTSSLEAELIMEEREVLKSGLERLRAIATSFFDLEIEEDELQREVRLPWILCIL